MEKKFIYALIDPRDNKKKYVGMSKNPQKRLAEHVYDSKREKTKKGNWLKNLISLNLIPILDILMETNSTEVEKWETYFIKKFKDEGHKLLNYDENGVGTKNGLTKTSIRILKNKNTIKIVQYDLLGNKLNEFNSLREAERITNINHGNISRCCNGIFKHTGGFIFKKLNFNDTITPIYKPNAAKKIVVEVDSDGNELETFSSISDASKKTKIDASNISRVCNNILKKTNNRFFKFKENE